MTSDGRAPGLSVDHVVAVTDDVELLLDFYRRVLGATVLDAEQWLAGEVDYPALHFRSFRINVHPRSTDAAPRAANPEVGALDLALRWPGPVSTAVEHLRRHGVEILAGPIPQDGADGAAESVYFRDPDGALLELICYPSDDGR